MNSKEDRFARSCVSFSDKKKKKDTYREKDGCETRNKKRDVKEELFLNIKLLEKILLKQSSMHYEQMQENSIFPTKRLFSFLFSFFLYIILNVTSYNLIGMDPHTGMNHVQLRAKGILVLSVG